MQYNHRWSVSIFFKLSYLEFKTHWKSLLTLKVYDAIYLIDEAIHASFSDHLWSNFLSLKTNKRKPTSKIQTATKRRFGTNTFVKLKNFTKLFRKISLKSNFNLSWMLKKDKGIIALSGVFLRVDYEKHVMYVHSKKWTLSLWDLWQLMSWYLALNINFLLHSVMLFHIDFMQKRTKMKNIQNIYPITPLLEGFPTVLLVLQKWCCCKVY